MRRAVLGWLGSLAMLSLGCGDDASQSSSPGGSGGTASGANGGSSAAGGAGGGGEGAQGGAGGDDPATPCDTVALDETHDVAFPGSYAIGAFEIEIDRAGAVAARTGTRDVYLSAPGSPALEAMRGELSVLEHQGSFDIEDTIDLACSSPRFDRARTDGAVLELSGGFDDSAAACQRLVLTMRWCESAEGEVQLRVATDDPSFNRLRVHLASDPGEHIYGLGEQVPHDTLDLKGRRIPVIAQEGGVGRGHGVISPAVNQFSEGSAGSEDSTYYAAPHIITSRLRSMTLENAELAVFDFEQGSRTTIDVFAPTLGARAFAGDSPLDHIERFTAFAGRMPLPPEWLNDGAIVALARPLPEATAIVDDLVSHDVQIAAVWNQTWSGVSETFIGEQVLWNWAKNENHHPTWDAFVSSLDAQAIRTLCYINPMLREIPDDVAVSRNLYEEAAQGGYFVKNGAGDIYHLEVTAFEVGLIDLSNPAARAWIKSVMLEELVGKAGCSGWMADFAEALPYDAVMFDGTSAAQWHNRYPVAWAEVNREALEEAGLMGEVLFFNRSGHTRSPRHAMLLWQGDQLTTWDKYDGLVSAIHGLVGSGFSGIALNHSDTGGYTSLSYLGLGYDRETELLKRWTEMNAFTAALRTHEGNQPQFNAQIYSDDEAMDHFARFSKVYKALGTYRKELFAEASERGWPVVRHLWLHYPDDPGVHDVHDQFLLGSEILVAPIKNKCFTPPFCPYDKTVYFPEGEWVHLWSGDTYGAVGASSTDQVAAPIGEPAVFYKKGSPVAPTFVQNLAALGIVVPAAR